jgi:hypothetical protein
MKTSAKLLLITLISVFNFTALADEITDAIAQGLSKYQKGDLSASTAQLDYASTLIKQRKAEQILTVFPEPLSGWTAEDAESEAAGSMMFGGGISANKTYIKSEDSSVEISLALDSPMLQTMLSMFNNPAMIAMSGAKLMKINGQQAMLKKEDEEVELSFVINNNAFFTIKGYNVATADVKAYAKALKLEKLK